MRLVVTATAARQIRQADDWWVEHRQAAPGLLRAELERAFELITTHPDIGSQAANVELPGVRRVALQRTRYHVYYRASSDSVEVVGLWHSKRERGPEL